MNNFPSFSLKNAFVNLVRLQSKGVSLECIIHMVSIAVRMVQDRLLVILPEGKSLEDCKQMIGILELLYSQVSISIGKVSHYSLDFSVCFNPSSVVDGGFVELVPQSHDLSPLATKDQVAVPGSLAVPLLLYQPAGTAFACFDRVLFAGTFDHLHSGHKCVLTKSLLMAREELFVGFACDDLLKNKKCFDCLEPVDIRKQKVSDFLKAMSPVCKTNVKVSFLETSDAVGPAGLLDFDALVVTPESASGGEAVNETRISQGRRPVDIVVCDLLGNLRADSKLSSSSIRVKICQSLPNGESDLMKLRRNWFSLGSTLGVNLAVTSVWWSRIRDLYGSKPWKHYHTLQHIHEMIEAYMSEFELAPAEFMLAVWFHDAIYDPRSETSERDSVILFSEFIDHAGELHCNIDVDSIRLAIQLTKDHKSALRQGTVFPEWILKFLEVDLCILGASEIRYIEYAEQIRAEYTHLGIKEFKAGRSEFLRSYVDFNFKYLRNAHFLNTNKGINIAAELERLG